MNESNLCTTSGRPIDDTTRQINPETGQQNDYIVLCEEERKKGFLRPLRYSYRHVGPKCPTNPLRALTEEEKERHKEWGYVAFEAYPPEKAPITGRFWTQAQVDRATKGCGAITSMGGALAETWARDPKFYSGTFCAACRAHFPIEEFVWEDGTPLGT